MLRALPRARNRGLSPIFRIGRSAAQWLLPSRCLACVVAPLDDVLRGGVCRGCWDAVPLLSGRRCAICDEPLAATGAETCGRCLLEPPAFRTLRGAAPYRGSARSILLAFKFGGADYLGARIAELLIERLTDRDSPPEYDEVTSVPATPRSRRRRGEHAADLLADAIARRLELPRTRRVRKIRETERQSGLGLSRRRANVRGAFRARPGNASSILLVDDVATSGWTARECAAGLVSAGAAVVDVWCFARVSRDDLDPPELTDGSNVFR